MKARRGQGRPQIVPLQDKYERPVISNAELKKRLKVMAAKCNEAYEKYRKDVR